MSYEIERIEVGNGVIARIMDDPESESPRDWDNLGKMVCWHGRYTIGDKHDWANPADFEAWCRERRGEIALRCPVYMYDHSGTVLSLKPFHDPWDSGQVGYIYCLKQDAMKNWGKKWTRKKIVACFESEIQSLNQYYNGEVYGFIIEDNDGNQLDSCWGFYGLDYAREQAREMLDECLGKK